MEVVLVFVTCLVCLPLHQTVLMNLCIEGEDGDGCVACLSAYLHQKMFLHADSSPQPVYISCISYMHKYVWNVGTSLETSLLLKGWVACCFIVKEKYSNIHRLFKQNIPRNLLFSYISSRILLL